MQFDLLCPVENQGVTMKTNSKTGEPYALFKLFNLSGSVIVGVTFMVRAFDGYGGELGEVQVVLDELSAQPKSYFAENKAVSLRDFPDVKHITVDFLEVRFAEGEAYIKEGDLTEISITEPDYDERIRLLSAAGADAQCYAQDAGSHWVCVCGRPNISGVETCLRCGREKDVVMRQFSSKDALTNTLAEQAVAEHQKEEALKEQLAQKKAESRRKRKKVVVTALAVIAALVVLWLVITLLYRGSMMLLGNSAMKKGDYLTAYSRFAAIDNSKKLAEVSEQVRGNSTSNILQSGCLAADEENLYYLDMSYAIHKEEKATGAKTRVGDAEGIFLNVSGDWLYYVDAVTGQAICRTKTDGSETERIFEDPDGFFYYLTLVGNELYYVSQEPIENLTPEMQEQLALQGGSGYQTRLYRLTIGEKKPECVADWNIMVFNCYKDKIYYLEQTERAVYCMDRNGNNATKLISGPVYSFDILNDTIYYLDGTVNSETGMPKLSLEAAELDGTYREPVVNDAMVYVFGFEGEDTYYQEYTDNTSSLFKKTGTEKTKVAEACQMFNVRDGYLMYLTADGRFMKTTFDKSGMEEVVVEAAAAEPEAVDGTDEAAE